MFEAGRASPRDPAAGPSSFHTLQVVGPLFHACSDCVGSLAVGNQRQERFFNLTYAPSPGAMRTQLARVLCCILYFSVCRLESSNSRSTRVEPSRVESS